MSDNIGDMDAKNVVVYALFSGTAIWAIITLTKMDFARPAFIMQIIHGVFGICTNVFESLVLEDCHTFAKIICHDYVLPLIAAECTLVAEFEKKWAYLHLIVPTLDLIFQCLNKDFSRAVLDVSKACNICMIAYSAFTKENDLWGYGLAILYVIAEFSYNFTYEHEDETEAIYCVGSGAGDVVLWKYTQ